jgi:hypothetical protein
MHQNTSNHFITSQAQQRPKTGICMKPSNNNRHASVTISDDKSTMGDTEERCRGTDVEEEWKTTNYFLFQRYNYHMQDKQTRTPLVH